VKLVQWILEGDVLGCRQEDVVTTIPFGPVVYQCIGMREMFRWYDKIYFRVVGTMVRKKVVCYPMRSGSQNFPSKKSFIVTWDVL
jgi:hypothetical protein